MKQCLIFLMVVGLISASALAGNTKKRDREDPIIEQLETLNREFLQEKNDAERENILLGTSTELVAKLIKVIEEDKLQDEFLQLYTALHKRAFVRTSDNKIGHYREDALREMEMFRVVPEAELKKSTLEKPLAPPGELTHPLLLTLYQVSFIVGSFKGEFEVKDREWQSQFYQRIAVIPHRNKIAAAEALRVANQVGVRELSKRLLARATAADLEQYPKAFPKNEMLRLYAEFLPANVQALGKDLLGMVMREFYLLNKAEKTVRVTSKCFRENDMLCVRALETQLVVKPFSIYELEINHKLEKVKASKEDPHFDLSEMGIEDIRGLKFINTRDVTKSIGLYGNVIRTIPDGLFRGYARLESINMYQNQLQHLPASFLPNNGRIKELDFSDNQLEDLPANFLTNCGPLEKLELNDNRLRDLPESFLSQCPSLRTLHLENNYLPPETIEKVRARLAAQGLDVGEDSDFRFEPQNIPPEHVD